MKKIGIVFIVLAMVFSVASCGNTAAEPEEKETAEPSVSLEVMDSEEAFREMVLKEVETSVAALNEDYEKLTTEIDTYDKFAANIDRVEKFYGQVYQETVTLGIKMREYSAACAEAVILSGKSNDEKDEALEKIYDCIYEDAGEAIYDEIYEGILENMYDAFYGGVLEDGYDAAPYDDWLDTASDEYDRWLDTCSDVYDEWLDYQSDIYDFWLDVEGEVWDGDMERARENIETFKADIEALKETSE